MQLNQYVWSGNPRGLHNHPVNQRLNHNRYIRGGYGWFKMVVTDTYYVRDAAVLLNEGITPIIRIWRPNFGSAPFDADMRTIIEAFMSVGVRWFEFYNEPNQAVEWPVGTDVDWRNMDLIRPMIDNWLVWAEYIISRGAYPGFISLTETAADKLATVRWLDTFFNYLGQVHYERFRNVIANGMFAATHPYVVNHYYQEMPGQPYEPRPPEMQRSEEDGWHFEYPFDPISQISEPGLSVATGPAWKPHGDPVGLIAVGQMFNERLISQFASQVVPVVGTEGGIWPFPMPGQTIQPDPRYPAITHVSHAEATVAMFEWIAQKSPEWMFGVCLWKEDEYYDKMHALAVNRLEQIPPIFKMAGSGASTSYALAPVGPPGPGPVHGEPDFHMIILAPGLDADWFFETAQPYWNTFRPIVTYTIEFVEFIPYLKSLIITLITPPDQAEPLKQQILDKYPNVLVDVVLAEGDLDSVRDVFNARVWANSRLG